GLPRGPGEQRSLWRKGVTGWGPIIPVEAELLPQSGGGGVPGSSEPPTLGALQGLHLRLEPGPHSPLRASRLPPSGPAAPSRLAPDSRLNPHRSLLGTGNYDVNVIMAALQGLGLAAVWWDRRRPLSQLALSQVLGFILNLPSPISLGLLSLPLQRRHWVALRKVGGIYYNLDSKLREPVALGGEDELRDFLSAAMAQGPCEVLLVVTKDIEESGGWLQAA
ncbi:josephin-2-like, partial [Gracilinanus agilis]|uniref:josephin-2-like n=1 Tax=Gracilinanus agilis TaxID=191870 RepID=UPI001CFC6D84